MDALLMSSTSHFHINCCSKNLVILWSCQWTKDFLMCCLCQSPTARRRPCDTLPLFSWLSMMTSIKLRLHIWTMVLWLSLNASYVHLWNILGFFRMFLLHNKFCIFTFVNRDHTYLMLCPKWCSSISPWCSSCMPKYSVLDSLIKSNVQR